MDAPLLSAGHVKIAPSILNADFGHLADEIQRAESGGADWFHIDVMDGDFVPNITLGPMVVAAIRRATKLPLDVHMMVSDPARYIDAFHQAGADSISIHLEADHHPHRTLGAIRSSGVRAGLALNPGTPVRAAEDLLSVIDLLLLMSVNPGFGGQPFIPATVSKVARARTLLAAQGAFCEIEVDGGVNRENAPALVSAGASMLVAGSFVFQSGDPAAQVQSLRQAIDQAAII